MTDPFWQRAARHGLAKARDEASFKDMINEVAKAEEDTFEN